MSPYVTDDRVRNLLVFVVFATLVFAIVACSSPEPTATPIPPTATPETPEQPAAEQQGPIDEISPFGMEARDAVCVEAHADKETAAKIFEAIEKFNTGLKTNTLLICSQKPKCWPDVALSGNDSCRSCQCSHSKKPNASSNTLASS